MAAGRGTRLGADRPKALVPIGHGSDAAPLVTHALRGVLSCPDLSDVVVVAPPGSMSELAEAVQLAVPGGQVARHDSRLEVSGAAGPTGEPVALSVVPGGAERADSVAAGLRAVPGSVGIVLVHDAARAFTPAVVFERVVTAVGHGHAAVVPAVPVTDTIKTVDARDHVVDTPDRSALRAVQTPQGFLRETLHRAHRESGGAVTDDAGLVEAMGGAVFVVEGDPRSLKVTAPEDLARVATWTGDAGPVPASERAQSSRPPAGTSTGRRQRPVLLVLGGLPGSGKTTLARAWARPRGAAHLRVDTIEQALVRAGADHQIGPQGYAAAYALAADQLRLGLDVVADSVNPLPATRAAWRGVAMRAGARVLEVELTCATSQHRERVEGRSADIAGHRLPDWSAVLDSDYEPWPGVLSLDTTDRPVTELVARVDQELAE